MGVNMAGNCIVDDEICKEASRQEIIRRYYKSCDALVSGTGKEDEVCKIELLLKQAHASIEDRKVVPAALSMEKKTTAPAAAVIQDAEYPVNASTRYKITSKTIAVFETVFLILNSSPPIKFIIMNSFSLQGRIRPTRKNFTHFRVAYACHRSRYAGKYAP